MPGFPAGRAELVPGLPSRYDSDKMSVKWRSPIPVRLRFRIMILLLPLFPFLVWMAAAFFFFMLFSPVGLFVILPKSVYFTFFRLCHSWSNHPDHARTVSGAGGFQCLLVQNCQTTIREIVISRLVDRPADHPDDLG